MPTHKNTAHAPHRERGGGIYSAGAITGEMMNNALDYVRDHFPDSEKTINRGMRGRLKS